MKPLLIAAVLAVLPAAAQAQVAAGTVPDPFARQGQAAAAEPAPPAAREPLRAAAEPTLRTIIAYRGLRDDKYADFGVLADVEQPGASVSAMR